MKNLLIIGAGDFQLPLVQRASLSYNVLLAAPVVSDLFKPYIKDAFLTDVSTGIPNDMFGTNIPSITSKWK